MRRLSYDRRYSLISIEKYYNVMMMYSRGPAALAEQLGCNREEAQEIIDSVFSAFPKIKSCDTDSKNFAKKYGYTTTLWGRKRRLTDIKLSPYEFDFTLSHILPPYQEEYKRDIIQKLSKEYWNRDKKDEIIEEANKKDKVKIKDNTGFIARAERQVLNARIQGSASDMTKKAIVAIDTNEELRSLGFKIIVPIHDEILGECPLSNIKRCKELFVYEMENCAKDKIPIDIKVDPVCSFRWYGEELEL